MGAITYTVTGDPDVLELVERPPVEPGPGEVLREMGRDETFYAIDKARDLPGFEPRHSRRDVLDDPGAVNG